MYIFLTILVLLCLLLAHLLTKERTEPHHRKDALLFFYTLCYTVFLIGVLEITLYRPTVAVKEAIHTCEQSLPRSKNCIIVAIPEE